ncbi:MAG: choice-of-anchor Q domain-containing protein [Flavobacteriaceae bacterium]
MKKNILSLLVSLFTIPFFAQNIWYVSADGTGNGTSWNQAYGSLSIALQNAQSGDEIWVAQGVYSPSSNDSSASFIFKDGVKLYGGFEGTETSLLQRADTSGTTTILNGELGENIHIEVILKVHNAQSSLNLIDGFTIKGANRIINTLEHGGAGIQVLTSTLNLKNCHIKENQISTTGVATSDYVFIGGAGIYGNNSDLNLEDVYITDNSFTIDNSNNLSGLGVGGAGMCFNEGAFSFIKGSLANNIVNYTGYGVSGGGYFHKVDSVFIANVMIKENKCFGDGILSEGAGLYFFDCSGVELINNIFHLNCTYYTQSNDVVVGTEGSDITFDRTTAVITNNTFGHTCSLFVTESIKDQFNSNLTFNNCVFTYGFAFHNSSTVTFNNCISKQGWGYITSNFTFNNAYLGQFEFISPQQGNYIPKYCGQFLNLGNNDYNPFDTDILGNPRIAGGTIDFGAIELQNPIDDTIYVDVYTDNEVRDGSSWETAFNNLQDALACKCVDGDTITMPDQIWVAEGVYVPGPNKGDTFLLNDGQKLYGGFQNGAVSLDERDISLETNQTILSGKYAEGVHTAHVVSSIYTNIDTELNGFIVQEGETYTGSNIQGHMGNSGAGILVRGQATFKNLWIRNNKAIGNDSGLHWGAGVYVYRYDYDVIMDSGIYMENVKITDNQGAEYGGGITFKYYAPNGTIPSNNFVSKLKNVEISNNTTYHESTLGSGTVIARGRGAGIYVDGMFNIDIEDFYIADNRGVYNLGIGIVKNDNAQINLKRGIFEGNRQYSENPERHGSSVIALGAEESNGTLNIESVIFSNNQVKSIIIAASTGNVNITNCTFVNNIVQQSPNFLELSYGSNTTIKNSIIDFPDNDLSYIDSWDNGYTLTAENTLFTKDAPSEITLLENILENTEPLFVDKENGNYQLASNSPAINAGNNSFLSLSPDFDAIGNPRVIHNLVDLGALEYQSELSVIDFDSSDTIKLYPNPTSDYMYVNIEDANIKFINIYSLQGKELLSTHDKYIDLSSLSNGMYIVLIHSEEGKAYSAKIIKE